MKRRQKVVPNLDVEKGLTLEEFDEQLRDEYLANFDRSDDDSALKPYGTNSS